MHLYLLLIIIMSKRARSVNLTEYEKILLVELVLKYQAVVDNKRTDAVSTGGKEEGWRQLISHC